MCFLGIYVVLNLIAPFPSFENRQFSKLGSVAALVFTAIGSRCGARWRRRNGASFPAIRNAGIRVLRGVVSPGGPAHRFESSREANEAKSRRSEFKGSVLNGRIKFRLAGAKCGTRESWNEE